MGDYPRPFSGYDGGDDEDDDDDGIPKIRVGICAMSKKVHYWQIRSMIVAYIPFLCLHTPRSPPSWKTFFK